MALLQFNPAPIYILDEVDAALDLSHTQNIGRLIKTRFKGSQFIVVSLKDGMFQNANRIFRTRFSEGTSVVQGPYYSSRSLRINLSLSPASAEAGLRFCDQGTILLTWKSSHECRLQVTALLVIFGSGMAQSLPAVYI